MAKTKTQFTLPKTPSPPYTNLADYKGLLYGVPKIGKTTFFANPDCIIYDTEAGTNALECYAVQGESWWTFLEFCAALESDERFSMVAIDTVDVLYQHCLEHVCEEHGIKHPSDLDWGKGWGLVNKEFQRAIIKLAQGPRGLWFTSHSQDITLKTRTAEMHKTVPTLGGKARDFLIGFCDIILYAEMYETTDGLRRVLHAEPSDNWEAGDRTGRLPGELPLDWTVVVEKFEKGEIG